MRSRKVMIVSDGSWIFDYGSMGVVPPLAYATGLATVLVAVFFFPKDLRSCYWGTFIEFLLNKLQIELYFRPIISPLLYII